MISTNILTAQNCTLVLMTPERHARLLAEFGAEDVPEEEEENILFIYCMPYGDMMKYVSSLIPRAVHLSWTLEITSRQVYYMRGTEIHHVCGNREEKDNIYKIIKI